ncbi:MMPL family transporter [Streptomyces sp. CA-181903]|uniref:MMPL family transporter n=1 Tax=Streptomyces sp. CA-181903 TaxID=3240055 RepID=UPI003D927837
MRGLPAPGRVLLGGPGAQLADVRHAIKDTLPWVLALTGLVTTTLVMALTRSPLLAVKALVMNTLSLGAGFGLLVYVFQDGHLRWLGGDFTVTGGIDAETPVLIGAPTSPG